MSTHEVDVLIIGGGIQGAWLLRDAIKRNLNALLITKLDHGGESLHGHNAVPIGYFSNSEAHTKNAIRSWEQMEPVLKNSGAIQSSEIPIIHTYMVDAPSPQMEVFKGSVREAAWNAWGLKYEKLDNPPHFAKDPKTLYYKINENIVEWRQALNFLLKENSTRVFNGEVEELQLSDDGSQVQQVRVTSGNNTVIIKPHHLFMAAGAWNYQLLYKHVTCKDTAAIEKLHQSVKGNIVKVPMFCIRGSDDALPALAGISFGSTPKLLWGAVKTGSDMTWFGTLFPPAVKPVDAQFDPNAEAEHDPELIKNTWNVFKRLVPALEQNRDKLKFGFYFGWKCEHPSDHGAPKASYVTNFGLSNTTFVWPVAWGNAPIASEEAFKLQSFSESAVKDQTALTSLLMPFSELPPSHVETIPLVSYQEFQAKYAL